MIFCSLPMVRPPLLVRLSGEKSSVFRKSKITPRAASSFLLVPTVTVFAWCRIASMGRASSSMALPRQMSSRSRGDDEICCSLKSMRNSSRGSFPEAYLSRSVISDAASTPMDEKNPWFLRE